jgi:hypothetical protein
MTLGFLKFKLKYGDQFKLSGTFAAHTMLTLRQKLQKSLPAPNLQYDEI